MNTYSYARDAQPGRPVDSLFDQLSLSESAVLSVHLLDAVRQASDAVIMTVGGDNYEVQRRLFEMQQEFGALHHDICLSRQPKIDAFIAAANADPWGDGK